MKIEKLILENFRCFYGKVETPINDFTVFIGKNDQGKSSILEAIDIFINEGKGAVKIDENDLNYKAKEDGVDLFKIGIIFKNLPNDLIIDATNPTNLSDEYLLNENKLLEIWKTFKKDKILNTSIKCYHPINDDFLKNLMKKKINELQNFVDENNINTSNIDKRKSADLRKAIRDYYLYNKDKEPKFENIEIEINEEGLKDIWSKLINYLPLYALFHSDRKNIDQDEEIQDPLKYKIEEIFKKNDICDKLNEIGNQINNEAKDIAQKIVKKFQELTDNSLIINVEPDIPDVYSLKWKDVYKNVRFKTDNNIPLNKRGSGTRRIILLSSFLADIEKKNKLDINNHNIYAIEEPETSLHPDLQKIMINTLKELSEKGNYQILISTHSPALIRLFETSSVRYVEKDDDENGIIKEFNEGIFDKIIENLGLLPNIGKVVICVEGKTDEEFLININQNIIELKEIIDLNEKIQSGLIAIIPVGGSNLKNWIDRYAFKNTNAIEFHLYDKDKETNYKPDIDKVNKRDGCYGILTQKREIENYISKKLIENEFNIRLDNIDSTKWDEEDISKKILEKIQDKNESNIKKILCGSTAKKITKKDLEEINAWEEVKKWFEKIKEMVNKVTIND